MAPALTDEPDPFTEAEHDAECASFRRKQPQSFPLVYTLFHTALRTGEVVGLRCGAGDPRAGTLTVRISRSRGDDNPPRSHVPLAKLHAPVIALHVRRRHPVGSVVNAE